MRTELKKRSNQRGMTLVELLIALTILVIGMGGVMIMIATAIAQNNGTKHDSNGTMLAQMVTEQIISISGNLNPPPALPTETDCAGTVFTIQVTGAAAPGAGAATFPQPAPAGRVAGDIDFTQAAGAVPANYRMQFVACGNNNRQATYDVRWNIRVLGVNTKLVTVAARRIDQNNRTGLGYNVPVTIRTIVGL